MRRTLIGAIVAIFGIGAAFSVGYPAGARSAKGHHAGCASKSSKSKAKQAKRRAKCKKRRGAPHGQNRVAQKVGQSPLTAPSMGRAPAATAPATSPATMTRPTTAPPTTTPAATPLPTATTPTPPANVTLPAQPEPTETKPRESPNEVDARKLLAELRVPEGAVEVEAEPGLAQPPDNMPCSPRVDLARFWRVPGETPSAVVSRIAAQVRADVPGINGEITGEGGGPGGVTRWSHAFPMTITEPEVILSEWLEFEAIAAEGGGAVLRADAIVIPAGAGCGGSAPGV